MTRPKLFVSLCTGTGADVRALVGGTRPVSGQRRVVPRIPAPCGYMGGKNRFVGWQLEALGLTAGSGADHILMADGGPWGWVWPVLLDPELSAAVAAELRSVATEDPRELWEALAAWPVADSIATRTAQWLWLQARSASSTPIWHDGGAWVMCQGRSSTTSMASQRGRWAAAATTRCSGIQSPGTIAERLHAIQAVAAWVILQAGNALGKPVAVGPDGRWKVDGYAHLSQLARAKGFKERLRPDLLADRIDALAPLQGQPISVWGGRVEDLHPQGDHSRTVVAFDPPYRAATGYALNLVRPAVVDIAGRWDACGAAVLVCEAEPIAELVELGWYTYEVTHLGRKGAKPEFVTMNRPAQTRQASLFRPGTVARRPLTTDGAAQAARGGQW